MAGNKHNGAGQQVGGVLKYRVGVRLGKKWKISKEVRKWCEVRKSICDLGFPIHSFLMEK